MLDIARNIFQVQAEHLTNQRTNGITMLGKSALWLGIFPMPIPMMWWQPNNIRSRLN